MPYQRSKCTIKLSVNFFKCNVGVRQSENLSPVLLTIYLDDLQAFVSRLYNGLNYLSTVTKDALFDDDVELFFKLYKL